MTRRELFSGLFGVVAIPVAGVLKRLDRGLPDAKTLCDRQSEPNAWPEVCRLIREAHEAGLEGCWIPLDEYSSKRLRDLGYFEQFTFMRDSKGVASWVTWHHDKPRKVLQDALDAQESITWQA